MATPLMIFASERLWTEDKERALIAFFSKHSCLWNHKSESYKNKQLRQKILEQLRVLLSTHPPPVPYTVEDIKSKFKNLRTTFQRQFKLVKASKATDSEDDFIPQWKYYHQLMFLQNSLDQEDDPDQPPPSLPGTPLEVSLPLHPFLPAGANTTSSPCVPSMVRCYWTEERERALISFYSEHSCLWNKKSENHNNRSLRLRLLETLRSQLSGHNANFSVEDVKCKFKNLRTVFNREYKAVQASRTSRKPYRSRWKHYQQLLFLSVSCDEDDTDEAVELAIQTSSSSCQIDIKPGGGGFQIFSSASLDHVKTAANGLPPSPSGSPPDTRSSILDLSASCMDQGDRPSTDSHCLWSDAKVQQLISFFSEHGSLWDRHSEGYRKHRLRQNLLEKLSRLLSENEPLTFTVDDIKTKFRNLRTTFQREHKAVRTNRTCGSEDFYLPKWKHYQQLMFLCESCDEDKQTEDPDKREETGLLLLDCQSPLAKTPSDCQRSSPSPPSSPSPSSCSSRLSRRRRASHDGTLAVGEMLDLLKSFCQNQPASPHAGFLKYVEECLNDSPPDKVRRLKKRIIETIHSVSDEG